MIVLPILCDNNLGGRGSTNNQPLVEDDSKESQVTENSKTNHR